MTVSPKRWSTELVSVDVVANNNNNKITVAPKTKVNIMSVLTRWQILIIINNIINNIVISDNQKYTNYCCTVGPYK